MTALDPARLRAINDVPEDMMTDNPRAVIGGNMPPDPIDEITKPFDAYRQEAENWLDGEPVQTESQMNAVDAIRKQMRDWRIALEAGQKSATAPLYEAYKTEGDRWKPTIEDAKRIEKCLVSAVDVFKRKLAEEKALAEREARAEADRKMHEAREAAALADASNLEAQRAADDALREAEEAQRRASAAAKDKVTGLRTVTTYHVIDARELARYLWEHDRAAMDEYMAARGKALGLDLPGVFEQRKEKVAY